MITCKNCGASIEENSKFCGFCGATNIVDTPQPTVENNESISQANVVSPVEVTPVQPSVAPAPVVPNVEVAPTQPEPAGEVPQPVAQQTAEESILSQPVGVQNGEVPPEVEPTVVPQQTNGEKKKGGGKTALVLLIVLIALGAIGYLVYNYLNNSTTTDTKNADGLVKAISNLDKKGSESGTVTATVDIKGKDESSNMNLSLITKFAKANDKVTGQIQLAKSLYFNEINLYTTISKDDFILYIPSSLIDMMGMTSSSEELWIKYEENTTNVLGEDFNLDNLISTEESLDYSKFINNDSVKYVGKEDGLTKYSLIIDQKLIDNVKELSSVVEDTADTDVPFDLTLEDLKGLDVSFYVDSKNLLSKIKITYSGETLEELGLTSFEFTITFSDLNSTVVSIPEKALNSVMDIEAYVEKYASIDYEYDEENDFDF